VVDLTSGRQTVKNLSNLSSWSLFLVLLMNVVSCHAVVPVSLESMSRSGNGQSVQRASGSLTIRVTLPRQAQALTSNTQSLRILLRNTSLLGADIIQTANGSGAQTLVVSALPPGSGYTLYAGAYSGLNATGTLMSWGQLPLTIVSGTNNVSLGLSVRVASGSGADDLVNGPAGSSTLVASTQWVQTTIADFTPGSANNVELFVPGMYNYLGALGGTPGATGSANGQFNQVDEVAFDRTGNMYVCDRNNQRIQVFDTNFNFLRAWGNGQIWTSGPAPTPVASNGNGYFNNPTGLTLDAQSNAYVTDQSNQRVQKFDSNGNFLMGWGSGTTWTTGQTPPAVSSGSTSADAFYNPHKPLVDRDNNVWISDLLNNRLVKYSPNGAFLLGIGQGTTWTSAAAAPSPAASGSAISWFFSPWGTSFDAQGNLYVSDLFNSRLQEFTPTGGFVAQWGAVGSSDGQFPVSSGVMKLDPLGRVWVANFNTSGTLNYLQIFTTSGQYLARLTGPSATQLWQGRTIAFDSAGNAYAGDVNSGVISKFQGASPTDANGGVRLAGYRSPGPSNFVASGTYVSPVLDAQSTVNWGSIYWVVSNLPTNTGLAVGVATSSDAITWGATQSVAATSVAGNNVASLSATSFNSRFLKYQLTLTSINAATTSEVQEVGVIY
jgi:hypothetical protein